jgi:transposase
MGETSKVISGLRRAGSFTISERHKIIQEAMTSGQSKLEIWKKYTGSNEEHGNIFRWMRQLGYNTDNLSRRITFGEKISLMGKKQTTTSNEKESFEILQLKKRIYELENQLKDAEMKAIAFSTMVDIAEKEFNIPIRKKLNTKPLKK